MGVVKHTHSEDKSSTHRHTKVTVKVTGPAACETEIKQIMAKADELYGYAEEILEEQHQNAEFEAKKQAVRDKRDPDQTQMLDDE